MPWERSGGGYTTKDRGGFVKNPAQYEKLRAKGMSKQRAAAITNSVNKGATMIESPLEQSAFAVEIDKALNAGVMTGLKRIGTGFKMASQGAKSMATGGGVSSRLGAGLKTVGRGVQGTAGGLRASMPSMTKPGGGLSTAGKATVGAGAVGLAGGGYAAGRRNRFGKSIESPLETSAFMKRY